MVVSGMWFRTLSGRLGMLAVGTEASMFDRSELTTAGNQETLCREFSVRQWCALYSFCSAPYQENMNVIMVNAALTCRCHALSFPNPSRRCCERYFFPIRRGSRILRPEAKHKLRAMTADPNATFLARLL
jgi:hypothetical protein